MLQKRCCGMQGEKSGLPQWLFEERPVWLDALLRFLEEPDVLVVPPLSSCLEYSMFIAQAADDDSIDNWNLSNPMRATHATCGSIF